MRNRHRMKSQTKIQFISFKCFYIMVVWTPRPVKVGAFFYLFTPFRTVRKWLLHFLQILHCDKSDSYIIKQPSTTVYICLQNAAFLRLIKKKLYNKQDFLFRSFTLIKYKVLINSYLKFCRKCRSCRSRNRCRRNTIKMPRRYRNLSINHAKFADKPKH